MVFTARSSAKYILSGEHSVLRGYPAIVFPIPQKYIELSYSYGSTNLKVDFTGEFERPVVLVFWGLLSEAMQKVQRKKEDLKGNISIYNNIPLGMGMGFSAALCVVITKLFIALEWLGRDELFAFATSLEDYFHGKSSGLDILGSLSTTGMYFNDKKSYCSIDMLWQPHLYLMYSGKVSVTAKCVKQVADIYARDQKQGKIIDIKMAKSVEDAKHSLIKDGVGFSQLAAAINNANECFKSWGLVPPEVESKVNFMLRHGAVAVKPTGAGDGGFLLGLWESEPSAEISARLIKV